MICFLLDESLVEFVGIYNQTGINQVSCIICLMDVYVAST